MRMLFFLLSMELVFQVRGQNRHNVDRTRSVYHVACVDILMRTDCSLLAISHECIGVATLQASFGESTGAGGGEAGRIWGLITELGAWLCMGSLASPAVQCAMSPMP